MNCNRARRRLQELFDGELDSGEEARLRLHVAACDACAGHAQTLDAVVSALRASREVSPRAGLAAEIAERACRAAATDRPAPAFRRVRSLLVAAAIAASLLFLGSSLMRFVPRAEVPDPAPAATPVADATRLSAPIEEMAKPSVLDPDEPILETRGEPVAESGVDVSAPPASAIPEPEPPYSSDPADLAAAAASPPPIPLERSQVEESAPTLALVPPEEKAAEKDASPPPDLMGPIAAQVIERETLPVSVRTREDGGVEVELSGSVAASIPVLLTLLRDPDRRVEAVAEQELRRISRDLVSTRVLPPAALEALVATREPRATLRDRVRGRRSDEPEASPEERWSTWWKTHRAAIVEVEDAEDTRLVQGGYE